MLPRHPSAERAPRELVLNDVCTLIRLTVTDNRVSVQPRNQPGNVVFKDADRLSLPPTRPSTPLAHPPRRNGSFLSQQPVRHASAQSVNGTPSNVGRRREYASSLLTSPARPSHTSKMAKIFQDARASLRKENMSPSNPLRSLPALKSPLM